jgi:UDP-N-acetylmuramate dehydrogenase
MESMPAPELQAALSEATGVAVRVEEPLSRHLPLRLGGPVELWVHAHDEDALTVALKAARSTHSVWRVHWPFEDWLVRDGGLKGAVIRLGRGFEAIVLDEDTVTIGSAALWSALPSELQGPIWDELRTWPGCPGGWTSGGWDEELDRACVGIRVHQSGRILDLAVNPGEGMPSLNKNAVLLSITLHREIPPRVDLLPPPAPGAIFQQVDNTTVATELDKAGLTGTRLRRWRISRAAPGTVVQLGGGSCKDLMLLVQGIRTRVEKQRGVKIQTRIPLLGNEPGRRR